MMQRIFLLLLSLFSTTLPASAEIIHDGTILDRVNRYDGYPVHLLIDGVHHIWFCGQSPETGKDGIYHSQNSGSLRDTSGWSTPVEAFNINDVSWALMAGGIHVCDPTVIPGKFDYSGSTYDLALYFTADTQTAGEGSGNAIGVAFSNDGISWTIHPSPIIEPEGGYDDSYGAGASGVAWGPEPGVLHQVYRDSTTDLMTDWRIRYKYSTDGLVFMPTPSLDTHLSDAALSNLGSAPEIAFYAPARRWYGAIQEIAGGDSFTGRILEADGTETLFANWSTVAGLNGGTTGEELLLLPSIAKTESSSLLVDGEGWAYAFVTTGNLPDSGAGVNTWTIDQVRVRLFETLGDYLVDELANVGPNRAAGAPLNGTASESGIAEWTAAASWIFGSDHVTTGSASTGSTVATIPFDSAQSPSARLQVDLDPTGSSWTGTGFSANNSGLFGGEIWLQFDVLGRKVRLFADGTSHLVAQADIPSIGNFHRLEMEHERIANTVSAWLDGRQIADSFDLDSLGFIPDIRRAGFQIGYLDDPGPKILRFQVNQRATLFADGFESGDLSRWSSFE